METSDKPIPTDSRENLIHDYFILLKDTYGYIDIKFVKPPKNITNESSPNIVKKIFNLITQNKNVGRFHELPTIRDNIREHRIKAAIGDLSRTQLNTIMYDLVTDNKVAVDQATKALRHGNDDKAAILVIFEDLTTDEILSMVNELIDRESPDNKYDEYQFK